MQREAWRGGFSLSFLAEFGAFVSSIFLICCNLVTLLVFSFIIYIFFIMNRYDSSLILLQVFFDNN